MTMHPIDCIDAHLLKIAAPNTPIGELALWADPLKRACHHFGIDTVREVASFIANTSHECAGFTRLMENLNYSAQRLAEVWPKRFAVNPRQKPYTPNALALKLHRNPQLIANHVYANRMGNGPPESGDGWRHRGFGPIMLTGAYNQGEFGKAIGMSLDEVPDYLRTREGGAMSAGWFWQENDLDRYAATPGIEDDREAINGGQIGVHEVRRLFNALIKELLRRGC